MPSIYETFPDLFDEQLVQQQDWRLMKERLLDYASNNNKKFEGD